MRDDRKQRPHPGAEPPADSTPNTPWTHSHLSQVLAFLYFANTASSEPRSHTKNNSVLTPARPARSPLPWLGTLGFRLNRSRTRLPPEASRPRGGNEGSGWPVSALRPPNSGGRLCLPTHFPREEPSARSLPAAWGRLGGRSPSVSPASGRSPHPPPAGTQSGGRARARSHQQSVLARQRPLGAVGGLGARDLDVDPGGPRFAGGGGAGRQGHVLRPAAGRRRVLAAQGAADGLRRVPQQVGDAAAAPAGLTGGRQGVLSVETTGGWVSALRSGEEAARPGRARALHHRGAAAPPSLGASSPGPPLASAASTYSPLPGPGPPTPQQFRVIPSNRQSLSTRVQTA